MDDGEPRTSRRRLLRATGGGAVVGLAGCLGASGDKFTRQDSREADDFCLDELSDTAPEVERTATSIDGQVRPEDDEEVSTKEEAGYKCGPEQGMQCGNCTFFIDDETGDGVGACTIVEGEIRSTDWCGRWQQRSKAAGPAGSPDN